MKKKRKLKIKNIIILLILIILIASALLFIFSKNTSKLEKIGYNKLEIEEIKKLTDEELNIIYKYDYNSNLIYMIKSDNYNKDNLDLYLKYTLLNKDIDYLKIFELINNENFKLENIDNYLTYLKTNNNIEGIIKYVNDYKEYNIDINETSLAFICEKYFIIDYIDRYVNYYNNNSDLSYSEIVTRINANLDHTFYTDSKAADLSKGMYTLVNKYNYLDKNYVPNDLVNVTGIYVKYNAQFNKDAYENFIKMADYMRENGMTIKVTTAYRSYSFQSTLYNNYVKADGVKNADRYSARPGYSEHQLGYSADLTNGSNVDFDGFKDTEEYKWLKDNSYKYGFILRYPEGKEYLTGYMFESWHYRYVGVDIATYMYENNLTYEEYYEYFLR